MTKLGSGACSWVSPLLYVAMGGGMFRNHIVKLMLVTKYRHREVAMGVVGYMLG